MTGRKKLILSVETLRFLNDAEMNNVVGGATTTIEPQTTKPTVCPKDTWETNCPTVCTCG